jgi:two-component system response regulator NreC
VCEEAADGVEAIQKALELKPDAIVLDMSMPKMNGLEAAAELHKIMPQVARYPLHVARRKRHKPPGS